jgi:hypothetical protein
MEAKVIRRSHSPTKDVDQFKEGNDAGICDIPYMEVVEEKHKRFLD